MLDYMREHSRSVLIYVLFGIIILAFVLTFGPGSITKCDPTPKYVARVNGKVLTLDEYRIELQELQNYYESRFGDAFTSQLAEKLGLRQSALENLIQNRLMLEEAEKLGIRVSDDEVLEEVRKLPWAKEDGKFSYERFEKMVRYHFKTSLGKFKERMRTQMVISRFKGLLEKSVLISDGEIADRFKLENEKVDLDYVLFDPKKYEPLVKVDDSEVASFMETHGDDIKKFYEEHDRRYNKPKAVRARRILLKVDQDSSEQVRKRLMRKAEKIMRRAKKGADFAELAKRFSDGPKKDAGGDLGMVEESMLAPELAKVVFGLKEGEVSEVFTTSEGFNIVKVEQIRPAVVKKLDDVKKEIAGELLVREKALELAKADADRFLAMVKDGKSFDQILGGEGNDDDPNGSDFKVKPKRSMTGPFTRDRENIPWIGPSKELLVDAFSMNEGDVAEKVYEVSGKFFIVQVRKHTHPDMADLERQKELIRNRIRDEKARKLLADWLKHAREQATIEVAANISLVTGRH